MQSLVVSTDFGNPARRCSGFNSNKLSIIIAMLEKRLGYAMGMTDIFLNVAGGLKVEDTAADLAAVAAIMSAFTNTILPVGSVFIGEVGLLGELRNCAYAVPRIIEAQRLGFKKFFIPFANFEKAKKELSDSDSILYGIKDVSELWQKIK